LFLNIIRENILKSQKLVFVPLGGSGEIGMNLNLYGYQNQWIIVDMGMTFGHKLGIDLIVPSIRYLEGKNILGIVATHGHEDHIGAIPYLWEKVQCPIYATPFTSILIKRKLMEAYIDDSILHTLSLNARFDLGPFDIQLITMTHSILEPNALAIRTPKGNIFHTGDWKLDPNPLIGESTDWKAIESFAKEGILAVVSDSTNALEEGSTPSEMEARHEISHAIAGHKQTVAITCFASNVARLESIVHAAHEHGRKPVIVGRSLWKMLDAAQSSGYLKNLPAVYDEDDFNSIAPSERLVVCTGSQGEPRSALFKMATGQHPRVKLAFGDVVIFSSRVIPGNEIEVSKVRNHLSRLGVHIITPRGTSLHVSGHPSQDDLKELYKWLKPRICIPVHGEHRHMKAHARIAEELGVSYTFIPQNGQALSIKEDGVEVIEEFEAIPCAVDGNQVVPLNHQTFRDRHKLMMSGVVLASLWIDKKGELLEAYVDCMGVYEVDDGMFDRLEDAVFMCYEGLTMDGNIPSLTTIEEKVRALLRQEIMTYTGKKPVCVVHVMEDK